MRLTAASPYICRYPALRDRLVEAHPGVFVGGNASTRAKFFALAERLSLRNQLGLTQAFRPLLERYAYLDPDEVELSGAAGGRRDVTGANLSQCSARARVDGMLRAFGPAL